MTEWIESPEVIALLYQMDEIKDGDEIIYQRVSSVHSGVVDGEVCTVTNSPFPEWWRDTRGKIPAWGDGTPYACVVNNRFGLTLANIKAWRRPCSDSQQ